MCQILDGTGLAVASPTKVDAAVAAQFQILAKGDNILVLCRRLYPA